MEQTQELPTRRFRHYKREQSLQLRICRYLDRNYPGVFYVSNSVADLHLTSNQEKMIAALSSTKGFPDITIFKPSRGFFGLIIEIKQDGITIYNKIGPNKGHLTADPHIRQQAYVLKQLNDMGYFARFGIGFDNIKRLIDWYLNPNQLKLI